MTERSPVFFVALMCAASCGLYFGTANTVLHLPYAILLYPAALYVIALRSSSPFRLGSAEHEFLGAAVRNLALSARAYTRILRVARTIADLEGVRDIALPHIAEALSCRMLDREQA